VPKPVHREFAVAGLVLLPVLCCAAGPTLLAAGALGVLGSWLSSPWLLGSAALLVLAVLAWRLRGPRHPDGACPAPEPAASPDDGRAARQARD